MTAGEMLFTSPSVMDFYLTILQGLENIYKTQDIDKLQQ